jgi:IS30 family transposase
MSYTHLSPEERYYIEISPKNEIGLAEIAASLERPQSTISREISRNTGRRGYRHKQAGRLARARHKRKPKSLKLTNEIKLIIGSYMVQEWSPEQVCGRLKKEENVTDAVISLFRPLKRFVKTLTFDNGKGFSCHEEILKALNCNDYFAKPYHSWERGQNENANGLLRQYFPKSIELIDITKKQVLDAIHKLNSRPRKCLEYKTPYEVFEELTGIKQKTLVDYALMT